MSNETSNVELKVEGMHCTSCAQGIETHLKRVGYKEVLVDFATSSAQVKLDPNANVGSLISEIERLGYSVVKDGESANLSEKRSFTTLEAKFYFSLFWTIPLFFHMFLPFQILHEPYVQLALCVPVFLVGLQHFGRSALKSLLARVPNMDVLIILGSSAAFIYSLFGTIQNLGASYLFYETAATIITLVLLGNLLEKRSVKKTTTAIEELLRIQPAKAKKVLQHTDHEDVQEISYEQLQVGDVILVNTGDKVAADGEIIRGQGALDQALISGESLPVEKSVGATVVGGSILVAGTIRVRLSAVGNNTTLAHIIKLVKDAQANKPAIQRLGDQVSAIFVPTVTAIAIATLVISYFVFNVPFQNSLLNSIAVLVIACPCAMGLATPTAVMVGMGRALKNGILFKGGESIERLAQVKNMVFDKTGTLSEGQFGVSNLELFKNSTQNEVASLIKALEQHSSHPIARSLTRHFKDAAPIELSDVSETKGIGISAKDKSGNNFELGSAQIVPKSFTPETDHDLYLVKNLDVIASFDISDRLRGGAAETMHKLKDLGLKLTLLSGDKLAKTSAVANTLGIKAFHGEKLPQQKLEVIEEIEKNGKAAFVGDGINDAPSLAKASVGVSLSEASEVAIQSAGIIILNSNLQQLPNAVIIARRILRTIKQNLFWAFCYNSLAIPIAALGYLNPMVAALTMALSDVFVIGNSLRLKTIKLDV